MVVVMMLPRWLGVLLAFSGYLVFSALAAHPVLKTSAGGTPNGLATSAVLQRAGTVGAFVAPLHVLAGTRRSSSRRRQRKPLVSASNSARTFDGIRRREFEKLFGEASRRHGYQVLESSCAAAVIVDTSVWYTAEAQGFAQNHNVRFVGDRALHLWARELPAQKVPPGESSTTTTARPRQRSSRGRCTPRRLRYVPPEARPCCDGRGGATLRTGRALGLHRLPHAPRPVGSTVSKAMELSAIADIHLGIGALNSDSALSTVRVTARAFDQHGSRT